MFISDRHRRSITRLVGIRGPESRDALARIHTLVIPQNVSEFIASYLSRYSPFTPCITALSGADDVDQNGDDENQHSSLYITAIECGSGGHCFYHCVAAALSGIHINSILPYWKCHPSATIQNNMATVCMLRNITNTYIELKKVWLTNVSQGSTASRKAIKGITDTVRDELSLSSTNHHTENDIDRTRCGVQYSSRDVPYADTPDVFGIAQALGIHILSVYTYDGTLVYACEHIDGTRAEWESSITPLAPLRRPKSMLRALTRMISKHSVIIVHRPGHYQLAQVNYSYRPPSQHETL